MINTVLHKNRYKVQHFYHKIIHIKTVVDLRMSLRLSMPWTQQNNSFLGCWSTILNNHVINTYILYNPWCLTQVRFYPQMKNVVRVVLVLRTGVGRRCRLAANCCCAGINTTLHYSNEAASHSFTVMVGTARTPQQEQPPPLPLVQRLTCNSLSLPD